MRKLVALALTALFITGCATTSQMPEGAVSEYLKTTGAGFGIEKDGDNTVLFYGMNYQIRKPLPAGVIAKVEFESPQPGGTPLHTQKPIEPGQTELMLQSPQFSGIINNHNYKVVLSLCQGDTVISTHADLVRFHVTSDLLQVMNIKAY